MDCQLCTEHAMHPGTPQRTCAHCMRGIANTCSMCLWLSCRSLHVLKDHALRFMLQMHAACAWAGTCTSSAVIRLAPISPAMGGQCSLGSMLCTRACPESVSESYFGAPPWSPCANAPCLVLSHAMHPSRRLTVELLRPLRLLIPPPPEILPATPFAMIPLLSWASLAL